MFLLLPYLSLTFTSVVYPTSLWKDSSFITSILDGLFLLGTNVFKPPLHKVGSLIVTLYLTFVENS